MLFLELFHIFDSKFKEPDLCHLKYEICPKSTPEHQFILKHGPSVINPRHTDLICRKFYEYLFQFSIILQC